MKAAVLHHFGSAPVYDNFADPVPQNGDQLIIKVKAAAVKNLDKLRASGTHYASYSHLPVVVGIDGVGTLDDGTNVYAQGITGMIAEKALVSKNNYTVLPPNINLAMAAALPNAVMGAALALHAKGKIKTGDVVLINGATGVTGQIAVQLAKYYGASKVIATGRNAASLDKLKHLGADETVSLQSDDEAAITNELKELNKNHPIDIVIDYLWGKPVELIMKALKGGGVGVFTHPVKIVSVGDMAGSHITVDSGLLRSTAIELLGSGLGSVSKSDFQHFHEKILPEMFALAADGKINIETHTEKIENIERAWNQKSAPGTRLVIEINK